MTYGLGIDVGAAFIKAAVSRGGPAQQVILSEHSVLLPLARPVDETVPPHPNSVAVLAPELARSPDGVKRWIGGPTRPILGSPAHFAATQLIRMLRDIVDGVTTSEGARPHRIVLTCPTNWGPHRRERFSRAAHDAGLEQFRVVTEAEAATALYAHRQPLPRGGVIAVHDLGATTFDVAIVRNGRSARSDDLDVIGAPQSIEGLGGDLFDETLFRYVDRIIGDGMPAFGIHTALGGQGTPFDDPVQRIRIDCTNAKEELSHLDETFVVVKLPDRSAAIRITRIELETMLRPHLQRTIDALRQCLRAARITAAELTGVVLVGGSSRIPLVVSILTDELGPGLLQSWNPQHSNALGAAELAASGLRAVTPSYGWLARSLRRRAVS